MVLMTAARATAAPRRYRIPRYLRPRPRTVLGMTSSAWTVALGLLCVVTLETVSRAGLISDLYLVPPSTMATRAASLVTDGGFLRQDLLPSVALIAVTFAVAGLLGIATAYLLWRSDWCRRAALPWLAVYYAIPVFAIYPCLVVLFGVGPVPILVVSVAFGTVVVVTNTLTGFDSVPQPVVKLARARRLGAGQYLRRILLPAAAPDILAGLRLGLVYSIIGVLATEFILSTHGLGHYIADAYHTFRVTDMYAGILLICVVALVLNVGSATVAGRLDWRRR
ncbi:ABC transporter permease [Pseudonocardia zijingensis]|uniref:ABC transporter permease n=2 Tax=Pseudonocardia zijingensis TaxID=153376 RepID=A0ABN1NKC4_9PSEU